MALTRVFERLYLGDANDADRLADTIQKVSQPS